MVPMIQLIKNFNMIYDNDDDDDDDRSGPMLANWTPLTSNQKYYLVWTILHSCFLLVYTPQKHIQFKVCIESLPQTKFRWEWCQECSELHC